MAARVSSRTLERNAQRCDQHARSPLGCVRIGHPISTANAANAFLRACLEDDLAGRNRTSLVASESARCRNDADGQRLHCGGRNPIHPSVALHLGALRDEAGRQMGTSFEDYGVSRASFRLIL